MNLEAQTTVELTDTIADERPSFAPNGRLIVYATQQGGRDTLMTTTLDGKVKVKLFKKMDLALKPGGVLIIQGYTTEQLKYSTGGPGKLDHLYDEAMLLDAFTSYDVLDVKTYEAEILEGSAHKGMSGLLGFVGRKRG